MKTKDLRSATDSNFRLPRAVEVLFGVAAVAFIVTAIFSRATGTDAMNQQYWLADYAKLVLSSNLLPRWIPTGFKGAGAPSFYFYPPLPFWLAAPISAITGATSASVLFQIESLLAAVGSFVTAWLLLRRVAHSRYQMFIGSLLYAIAPYKVGEWYSRSSIASTVGFVFVPLVALAVLKFDKPQERTRGAILLAVALTLAMLSNVPLALLLVICLVIVAVLYRKRITLPIIYAVSGAAILFLLLGAFQTLCILHWQDFVQLSHLVNNPEYVIDMAWRGELNAATFHYATLFVAFGLIVWAAARWSTLNGAEKNTLVVFLTLLAMLILLEVPFISRPIWLGAPLFHLIQGAWRFYIVLVLLVSMVVAVAQSPRSRTAVTVIVGIWSVSSIIALSIVLFHVRINPHTDPDPVDPPEYGPIYTIKDRNGVEDLVTRHAHDVVIDAGQLATNESATAMQTGIGDGAYRLRFVSPHDVTFHRFYWPAAHLIVKDSEIAVRPDSIGFATAQMPAGEYIAAWRIDRSPEERAGIWISGAAWFGVVAFAGISFIRRRVVWHT